MAATRYDNLPINGLPLFVCRDEGGGGCPWIVLHGWGASHEVMRPLALHLTRFGPVISVDLPGFGRSGAPPSDWGTPQYAALILTLLDRLKIDRAAWLGHSFGAKIALWCAAYAPQRVARMVLLAAPGVPPQHSFKVRLRMHTYKLARGLLQRAGAAGRRAAEQMARRFGSDDYRQAGALRPVLVRLVNEDLRPLLPKVACETLLLWGEADTAVPVSAGRLMAKWIASSRLVTFPGVGHYSFVDRLAQVCSHIDRFVPARDGGRP